MHEVNACSQSTPFLHVLYETGLKVAEETINNRGILQNVHDAAATRDSRVGSSGNAPARSIIV